MTDEEVKKVLAGFNKSFFQKLAMNIWQFLFATLVCSWLYACVTDTFVESDQQFALYYSAVTVVIIGIDIILRVLIKREKHEITE